MSDSALIIALVIAILVLALSMGMALHALLHKHEPRAALGWIILCFTVPIIGPLIYVLFGINRPFAIDDGGVNWEFVGTPKGASLCPVHALDRISSQLSRYPCSVDNKVSILHNGDEAYPSMLEAIGGAQHFVVVCTYIFDSDEIGKEFVEALAKAKARGVAVYVLIDSVGSLYSFPSAVRLLRRAGVRTVRFLPLFHRNSWLLNLRNHRKILAVDGNKAFVGGMNIGARHVFNRYSAGSTADVQFLVEGSAARALTDIFRRDWAFATGEQLSLPLAAPFAGGNMPCRPLSDGPGRDIGTLSNLLLGLIGAAKHSVTIVTPYFLPPPTIVGALAGAALRGVHVRVLLPERNNLPYVKWATEHALLQILRLPIEVYYQPGPFSHTKMLLIDDDFLQIGSYNMDARSLRLNFELALNVIDLELRTEISKQVEVLIGRSSRVARERLRQRSLPARIRNGLAWLLTPYL